MKRGCGTDLTKTGVHFLGYILVEEGEELDAQKCTSMIEKLHNIPDFVSKGTVARAREALDIVDKKLHECKVQGVLSLYYSLTENEKEEFRSIILQSDS